MLCVHQCIYTTLALTVMLMVILKCSPCPASQETNLIQVLHTFHCIFQTFNFFPDTMFCILDIIDMLWAVKSPVFFSYFKLKI